MRNMNPLFLLPRAIQGEQLRCINLLSASIEYLFSFVTMFIFHFSRQSFVANFVFFTFSKKTHASITRRVGRSGPKVRINIDVVPQTRIRASRVEGRSVLITGGEYRGLTGKILWIHAPWRHSQLNDSFVHSSFLFDRQDRFNYSRWMVFGFIFIQARYCRYSH